MDKKQEQALINWYNYVDRNGVLYNKYNITDYDELRQKEYEVASVKINELDKQKIQINGIDDLFKIHKHIFEDVYEWAGEPRNVNMRKDNTEFSLYENFDQGKEQLDQQIKSFNEKKHTNRKDLFSDTADIYLNINKQHFFREGNGRSQNYFITSLLKQKGIEIDFYKNIKDIRDDNKIINKNHLYEACEKNDKKEMENFLSSLERKDKSIFKEKKPKELEL